MAGIGFTLKKMFKDETFSHRSKAYLYSALVAAGPWIAAVITVNLIMFIMDFFLDASAEKDLFMGTIVYSFVFSQIITAPWQLLITRYISDKLYTQEYDFIRPSFAGLNKIVFISGFIVSILFYLNKPIPLYYKLMSTYLFVIISMIWILMVYLSAVKNYELIAKAYIYGGLLSVGLTILFMLKPLPFPTFNLVSNLLLAYLIGMSLTYLMLIYNFLATFYFGNNLEFDFIRNLNKFPSLFYIGLFYTLGLWVDDILMWFSIAGVDVYDTYLYAPIYDNAVFLAYLTIIPSMVLFLVSVETEFYDHYKKYYGLANEQGTFEEIDIAKKEMKESIYRQLLHTFEIQALLSVTIVLLSPIIFNYLNISIIIRNIFRITTFGALFNIFVLLIILVLLYFEVRKRAVFISIVFFIGNLVFTSYYSKLGIEYYGYGFLFGSLFALLIALITLTSFMRKINYTTFALQPLFVQKEQGIFILLADKLNDYQERKNQTRKQTITQDTKVELPM